MAETLGPLHVMDANQLNPRAYAESLIRQALSCHLLSEEDWNRIQGELFVLLAGQCDKWTRGESSSVPIETAQEIMTSILFVLSLQLKSCPSPEQAVVMLKSGQMKALFENGLQIVRRKMNVARRLQQKIMNNLLKTPNVFYRSTLVDGINGFFQLYRPQFAAHEIHITADYPVLAGRPELDGIEMIEQYLRCLEAENAFCTCFAPQAIHHLLCGLTQDYRSAPVNLFEYVMLSALGLAMLKRNPRGLNLSCAEVKKLHLFFDGQSEKEIASALEKAALLLSRQRLLPDSTRQYLSVTLPKLVSAIRSAVCMKTLDKLFLVPAYPERETKRFIDYGEQMDNSSYQKLVERILQIDQSERKIDLVFREVHALADLLDLLSDAAFSQEEDELLVDRLPLSAFVALLAQYPDEAFVQRESDRRLFRALTHRKQRLSATERQQVDQALSSIEKVDFQ